MPARERLHFGRFAIEHVGELEKVLFCGKDTEMLTTTSMSQNVRYEILDQNVAHEIIDGEAIIIHFDSGNYYSLEGISAQLWQWFAARASRQQILDAFQDLQPDQISHLDNFIESLAKERILMEIVVGAQDQSTAPLPKNEVSFELPKFTKYNDMQNLLLADPIHEVSEAGWPKQEVDRP